MLKNRINEIFCREKTIRFLLALLCKIVSLIQLSRTFRSRNLSVKRILHISPIYFSEEGMLGGGERAPLELAKTMSREYEVKYISFGSKAECLKSDNLIMKIYQYIGLLHYNKGNPINLKFLSEIKWADVIHCHQYHNIITNFAILFSKLIGKQVFVTDYGGAAFNFAYELKLGTLVDKFLVISKFGKQFFDNFSDKTEVAYLGVDKNKFYPLPDKKQEYVLYVGRILPHKGISYLISAVNSLDVELHIVGSPLYKEYFDYLNSITNKRKIKFILNVDDKELLEEYNNALITVLPSVYRDIYNNYHKAPELLGLTLLESMACETPVICTEVGGMPEIVIDGETGYIVPPNDSETIAEKINYLVNHKEEAKEMGKKARKFVLEKFTTDKTAKKYLNTYLSTVRQAKIRSHFLLSDELGQTSIPFSQKISIKNRINEVICREKTVKLLLSLLSKILSLYSYRKGLGVKKVLHISPIYFSKDGLMGGGERSPLELAKAMARHCETRYVSFGKRHQAVNYYGLPVEIYKCLGFINYSILNPVDFQFFSQIRWADVVHCHQYYSIITSFSILVAKLLGKRVFVTDHGGKGFDYNRQYNLAQLLNGFLMASKFHATFFEGYKVKPKIISSGIDENKFYPLSEKKQEYVLYVGRILPLKGVNYLVSAMNSIKTELHIVGTPEGEKYFNYLKSIAKNSKVKFFPLYEVADEFLLKKYNDALVTVLPSVQHDIFGHYYPTCESFGGVLVESMACETPVICTSIGGMPEIVQDGITGFIVPPNDSDAIAEKINYLLNHKEEAKEMGKRGREVVLQKFTMDKIALRCLEAYKES